MPGEGCGSIESMEPRENPRNRLPNERDIASLLARYGVRSGCMDVTPWIPAFVHKSYRGASSEVAEGTVPLQPSDYERLEHLGDAVLQLAVTDYLHERYPDEDESFLSQLRMKVVSGAVVSKLAFAAGLDRWTQLSTQAEASGARARACIAEDVFEAFMAALFRVHGYPAARAWAVGVIEEHLDLASMIFALRCTKDRLMRGCADRLGYRPSVHTTQCSDGMSYRTVVTGREDAVLAEATAGTAREAELAACRTAWDSLRTAS